MIEIKKYCDRCKREMKTYGIHVKLSDVVRKNEFDYCDRHCLLEDFKEKVGLWLWKKKPDWADGKTYCWYCKKDVWYECMDACCVECGRPYAVERCHEFGYEKNGKTKDGLKEGLDESS